MKAQQGSEPGAQLQQGTLAGTWRGQYLYPDGRQSVDFVFVFEADACRGRSEESNTFGDKSAPTLYADLSCDSLAINPGENIVISKTYDGTGNVSHTVTYSGILSADLREIAGQWSIERMRGAFNMRRQ
jgi:hypothetical protein